MKTAIIYSTKTGTTKKCAALLAANIGADSCDMFNIGENTPNLAEYDCVVIGSFIRMGVIDKKIAAYLKKNTAELLTVKYGLFLCSALEDKVGEAIEKNFSAELLDNAAAVDWFGCELDEKNLKGFDKLTVKMMLKASSADPNFRFVDKIHPEAITAFANTLKEV